MSARLLLSKRRHDTDAVRVKKGPGWGGIRQTPHVWMASVGFFVPFTPLLFITLQKISFLIRHLEMFLLSQNEQICGCMDQHIARTD